MIGNGDVTTPEDAKAMLETGCDGVMIGRGAVANPWVFKQIKHFLATGEHLPEPSIEERIGICLEHLKMSVAHELPYNGVIPFRKYYAGYLRGLPNIASVRSDLMQLKEYDAVVHRLNQYLTQTTQMV